MFERLSGWGCRGSGAPPTVCAESWQGANQPPRSARALSYYKRPYGKIKSAMRASGVARLVVAGAVVGGTACSIWAAISDPYKSDRVDAATGVPSSDARTDAGAHQPGRPIVDSGISPYAIAAYGDSVYLVGSHGEVEVARGASSSFATF